jgi:hypothetical protein
MKKLIKKNKIIILKKKKGTEMAQSPSWPPWGGKKK